jgi:glucose-6-phosphate isomerase
MERLDAIREAVDISLESLPLETLLALPSISSLLRRPSELLLGYQKDRRGSLLARIFKLANRSHQLVDRIVLFAPPEIKLAIETVWKTCCQPRWNELSRGDRGSKPRMTFVGHDLDNDAIQGTLHMLGTHRDIQCRDVVDRWSIVIIEPRDGSVRSELALKYFLPALQRQLSSHPELVPESVVAIVDPNSTWVEQYRNLGLTQCLELLSPVDGFDTLANAATLFPAALLGINVMELLAGAAAGSRCAEQALELPNSPIHLGLSNGSLTSGWVSTPRLLHLWSSCLGPLGGWYQAMVDLYLQDAIATYRIGDSESILVRSDADPISHRSADRLSLIRHHVTTDGWRFDELHTASGQTVPNQWRYTQKAFVDSASRKGDRQTEIHLPIIDELHIGQLMQWLQLATATERWLQNHAVQ